MADDEWKKLSTEDKIEHKNWKARVDGYEECIKLFQNADDPKNPIYLNYLGLIKKFVIDSNEIARERALDAVLAYVENIPAASKTVGEVLPGLVAKCLNGRAKTKEKSIEIIMQYIEIERQELVQEELIKAFENKQPKVVQASIEILRKALNEFGSKVIQIKPIIKHVPRLLEEKDKIVRDEAKLLAIEMYHWAGAAIMPQFQNLKPVLLQELEDEFKKLGGEKARQTRFLRSQQELKQKMEAEMLQGGNGGGGGGGGTEAGGTVETNDAANEEAVDPYDLLDPVDIMPKLPKDFREKIESKKWQDRKEVLEALQTILTQNQRLQPSDYYELVNDLKKTVAKDANIVVTQLAAKCLCGMAKGLRKDFGKYALNCLEPLMERFKEKKQMVIDTMREAIDAIYPSTNLEAMNEICLGLLVHKTPIVRQQVALFLAKCFAMCTQATLPKKLLKMYLPALIKNLSEADPGVRDANAEAIGACYKAIGEKAIMPMLAELDATKQEKVKEFADKCVLLNLKGEPRAGQVNATATGATATATTSQAKPGTTAAAAPPKKLTGSAAIAASKAEASASGAKKPDAGGKKDDPKKKVVKGGGGGGGAGAGDKKGSQIPDEPDMAQETVDEKAAEIFGAETMTLLTNSNWKDRQTAVETILSKIKPMPTDEVPTQVVARSVCKKPGLKDTHFQVLKQKFELILFLATETRFTLRTANYCINDIADKISDVKNAQLSKDILSKIAETIGLSTVMLTVFGTIFDGKNPKNQEHALLWCAQALRDFGYQNAQLDLKQLIGFIKKALENSNQGVRLGAIQLIGTLHMYVGAQIRVLFENEKTAILEQIDAEIEKIKGQPIPTPIRGPKRNAQSDEATEGGEGGEAGNGEIQIEDDLMPRTDISSLITDDLLTQLNDKNWKERQAALERLDTILKENKFIQANLNELPATLNKRLTDTNKILAQNALKISEKLAESMGSSGKKYVGQLASGMIQALSDNKEALRKIAVSALNAWVTHCGGLLPFLECGDVLVESFQSSNPNLKAELCGWLASVLVKSKKLPVDLLKPIIAPVFVCVEDRSQDVRVQAQALIEPVMQHVGMNEMLRVLQKSKPSSVGTIQPMLEKARADLAAKAPPPVVKQAAAAQQSQPVIDTKTMTKASTAKTATKPGQKAEPKNDYDDDQPAAKVDDKKAAAKPNGKAADAKAPATARKKGEEEDLSPPITQSNKNKRIDEEKALKVLKWNFDLPRKEFVEQLKMQFEPCVNRTLLTQLFHDDFKHHINALNTLTKSIEDSPDVIISNLDLLLKWLTLRFFETNPTVIVKAIDFMQALFSMLSGKQYFLMDFEANAFIPYFITRLGDPKDPIRKGFKQIVKLIIQVHAPAKVYNFLIGGLTSKNARQRTECLDELGLLIEAIGLNAFSPQTTLKEIAKQIADRDTSVRNAALNALTIAYQIGGEYALKCIGKLNEKDQSMLDERIKRSAKNPIKIPTSVSVNGSGSGSHAAASGGGGGGGVTQSASHSSIAALAAQTAAVSASVNGSSNDDHHSTSVMNSASKRVSTVNSATLIKDRAASTPKPALTRGSTQPIISKTKGQFQLDIKDDDDDEINSRDIEIKIAPHKDLDDLLNKPVGLPPRKTQQISYPVNILKESQDCKEAIDLVITHISHQQIDISFHNLLQIDVVIKDRDKRDLLQSHIDNLLNTCAVKLNVVHNVYLNNTDCKVEECFRLLKGLFTVILDVFECDLGRYCNVKTLKDVLFNLLCIMIDSKINNLPDGDQLIKAINMVTLKVLELSEQTSSYCALVKLLTDCCGNDSLSSKFLELVMKCIWRQIRRLSTSDNLVQQIDTSKVLIEIHQFLKLYPSNSWSGRVSDLPLRTIKTLLYHLAKAKQIKILEDLKAIEHPDESEIKSYIMKLFKNGFQLTSPSVNNNSGLKTSVNGGDTPTTTNGHSAAKAVQLTPERVKQVSDQLSIIFKKINSVEYSKQGLEDLYDFKQNNPDVDLTKHFKRGNENFQKYIEDCLEKIGVERKAKENAENRATQQSLNPFNSNSHQPATSLNIFSSTALSSSNTMNRNFDDIMKTLADWKSKNNLTKEPSDDNLFIKKSPTKEPETADKYVDILSNLKKKYTRSRTEPIHKINHTGPLNNGLGDDDDEAEPLNNDMRQLDLKARNIMESPNNSNGNGSLAPQTGASSSTSSTTNGGSSAAAAAAAASARQASDNLYDEYRKRLEQIKKTNPIK